MWERGQLGAHSQTSLINTIWWLLTLHWAKRATGTSFYHR